MITMLCRKLAWAIVFATSAYASCQAADREIRIVGSSTVFPFSAVVAERFGATTSYRAPVVERTGTGGGLKQFCAGAGPGHPDIANASRRMKQSEWRQCAKNNVGEILEFKLGYDGVVIAAAKDDALQLALTTQDIYLALAARVPASSDDCRLVDNYHASWADVSPLLPDIAIHVFGPPPTSGTRDAFVEIAMARGAASIPCLTQLKEIAPLPAEAADAYHARLAAVIPNLPKDAVSNGNGFVTGADILKSIAHRLREDGAWVDAGESDNAILQMISGSPGAVGVVGFSYIDQNQRSVDSIPIDGHAATFTNILTGRYPISRSLYFYVKADIDAMKPGLKEFVAEFFHEDASGEFGYLADKGLIPLDGEARQAEFRRAQEFTRHLSAEDLE